MAEITIPQTGIPEFGKNKEEIPKELSELFERSGGLPIEAQDLIEDIQLAEVGEGGNIIEITKAVDYALAYMEGLPAKEGQIYKIDLEPDKYTNIENQRKIAFLKNLVTTIETASKRPQMSTYLQIAIDECTDRRIRIAEKWRRNPQKFIELRKKHYNRINVQRLKNDEESLTQEQINSLIMQDGNQLLNEYSAINNLLGLRNYIEVRGLVDFAFRQRMATCEDPENASKLGGDIKAVTPDGGHWQAFFQTEELGTNFGKNVDSVLLEMCKFGLPDKRIRDIGLFPVDKEIRDIVDNRVYADAFNNTTEFAYWFKYHIGKAEGEADVFWNAWKLMLMWEVPEKLGLYIKTDNQKYVLSAPPIGNALMSFTTHLREKRMHEFGLKSNGERYQVEKFISHSGLPMSIDAIPDLCEDFLHQTKISFSQDYLDLNNDFSRKLIKVMNKLGSGAVLPNEGDPDYIPRIHQGLKQKINDWLTKAKTPKKDQYGRNIVDQRGQTVMVPKQKNIEVSLWDLRIYGGWSFADKTFPWLLSDQPSKDSEAGELPIGAFGSWLLTRYRASKVLEDVRGRPQLRDLGDPDFFASRLRNWTRVLGPVSIDVPPNKNPRAIILAAYIYYRIGGTGDYNPPFVKGQEEKKYRTKAQGESLQMGKAGREERGVAVGDILAHAEACGYLRTNLTGNIKSDADWINKVLDLHHGI